MENVGRKQNKTSQAKQSKKPSAHSPQDSWDNVGEWHTEEAIFIIQENQKEIFLKNVI